jgi:hypothetical protein
MKGHRQILAERIIRTILETAKPSSSGGYWSDFGPVTYAEMLEFIGDPMQGLTQYGDYQESDAAKLLLLASWLDDYDDARGFVGPREVQTDLRHIAHNLGRSDAPQTMGGREK